MNAQTTSLFFFGEEGLNGGLDSERIPENERDWQLWVYPDSNPKPLNAPNQQPKPLVDTSYSYNPNLQNWLQLYNHSNRPFSW